MKRVIVPLMVVVGALVFACTTEEESLPAAGLSGTYDVVLVRDERNEEGNPVEGDLLFVTSMDRNELRVLDLKAEGAERGYLRAPNPLEALSIPVLERPQDLALDVRYDATGADVGGSYVYARSNGSTRISVVASERKFLREVKQLVTNELTPTNSAPSAGPVTAFAARGPEQEGGSSTLYYTTQETTGAWLWELQVPAPQDLLAGASLVGPVRRLEGVLPANVAVSALLVLPEGQLAVATRSTAGAEPGKTYKVNPLTNAVMELDFGGQQVLQLATHEAVDYSQRVNTPPNDDDTTDDFVDVPQRLVAGARIYGVLDPSNCGGGQTECATGVLAVDANTGKVLKDDSSRDGLNNPTYLYDMLPIRLGSGLPTGLSVSAHVRVSAIGSTLALLGIVPLSSGQLLFFDAVGLRVLDIDDQDAEQQVSLITTQGTNRGDTGDVTAEVTNGVTTNETYVLTYQGLLPGMDNLARGDTTSSEFSVPGQVAQPADLIILIPEGVGGQPCDTELVVASVQTPTDPKQPTVLTTNTAIPPECAGYTRFQVRAAGSRPLVLSSGNEGFIQRLALSESYSRTGPYFFHPAGYTGASEGLVVRITVSNRLATDIARGDRYVVNTLSHYFPFAVTVDTSVQEIQFFQLPGTVVQAEVGGTDYAYIAYPSADGVLQVSMQTVDPSIDNSRGVFPFQ